ncbi:MAG: homoserine kinase [Candidatus Marinimicrobia bacterium]|jgi:homoserine kinase|nr:homoserine kinase [Candidatus Neomarinimicrobiota bacterium]MBT3502622.1 homoserine kinase [Candidatus Neomarinimicrobiota bacterium]MBT3839276.1 homoserine kinase [Candidatus Neomarinimicrobiota bacterium]MBT3999237.1 homoserine kinase [Candidatus Neomarinimicrobiota bacterium]MBT4281937.1 homoserine kinase [Candidatus Neomarinimicrobiota bacterium]
MGNNSIKIKGNASVANVSCGFDCIGYSISDPGDIITLSKKDMSGIDISMSGFGFDSISSNPEKNTGGKAVLSLLDAIDSQQGFKLHIEKGIPPGSGIGSSSASAAAAVLGANELLGNPLSLDELLIHGMAGEAVASGGFHADNIAPALFGGIILVRSYDPLDILKLPVPDNLFSTAVLPNMTINTKEAREILPKNVPLKNAVEQAGNLAGFTLGLHESNFELLGRSMIDHFAEPHRAKLIPGYNKVRQSALDFGAIGCGISGSGPSVFALSNSLEKAEEIGKAMVNAFKIVGLKSTAYNSPIHTNPPKILD